MPRKKNPVKKDVFSDIIKNFESFCSLTRYNRLQHDYKDIIRRRYTGMYDRKNEDIRRQLPEEKYKLLKTNDEYRNRRISAFVNVAADISPKFESKYPDICIEDELAYYCAALVHETPEWLGKNWYMTVAVALFILDSIVQSGQYYQAVYFIPRNNKTRHVDLPVSFRDSMFETDVIKGVMYLIINRHNSDEVYYSPETVSIKPDEAGFHSYLEHRITCEHMNHKEEVLLKYRKAEEMSLSERYYALISFIKPEILEWAAETYRKQCYEVADIVLEEANNSRKEFTELCSSAKKIIEEIKKTNKIMDSCKKEAASGVKKIHDTPKIKSIMANPDSPPADFFDPVHGTYTMMNYLKTREKRQKLSDELQKKILELYDKDYALLKNYDTINSGFIENIRYSENKRVTGFKNENPYETVFGFLYLLDCGDDIAWIPAFFECVCGYAVQRMPWVTSMCYDLRKMTYEKDGVENFEDEEWYEKGYALKYDDTYMWKREGFEPDPENVNKCNLAQIIYMDSHVVMPRYKLYSYDSAELYAESGFSREQSDVLINFKNMSNACSCRYGFGNVEEAEKYLNEESLNSGRIYSQREVDQLHSEKTSHIHALQQEVYQKDKHIQELEKKLSAAREKSESDSQELTELRDLIYSIQNSSTEENEQGSGISLPYTTIARVVVFGGHPTWLKVIVNLLPNVRFIDPYTVPDANLIKNADVVWLQTNAMAHNKYAKIMEIVRSNKIPLKYFACASAAKCALQLARYDMENF